MTKMAGRTRVRFLYLLASAVFLLAGFIIYSRFRSANILLFQWINYTPLPAAPGEGGFADFIRYNLPDGLWVFAGLGAIRFLCFNHDSICRLYIIIFYILGFVVEVLQAAGLMPGTFDFLDLLTMGLFALVEQIIYFFIKRRLT